MTTSPASNDHNSVPRHANPTVTIATTMTLMMPRIAVRLCSTRRMRTLTGTDTSISMPKVIVITTSASSVGPCAQCSTAASISVTQTNMLKSLSVRN